MEFATAALPKLRRRQVPPAGHAGTHWLPRPRKSAGQSGVDTCFSELHTRLEWMSISSEHDIRLRTEHNPTATSAFGTLPSKLSAFYTMNFAFCTLLNMSSAFYTQQSLFVSPHIALPIGVTQWKSSYRTNFPDTGSSGNCFRCQNPLRKISQQETYMPQIWTCTIQTRSKNG